MPSPHRLRSDALGSVTSFSMLYLLFLTSEVLARQCPVALLPGGTPASTSAIAPPDSTAPTQIRPKTIFTTTTALDAVESLGTPNVATSHLIRLSTQARQTKSRTPTENTATMIGMKTKTKKTRSEVLHVNASGSSTSIGPASAKSTTTSTSAKLTIPATTNSSATATSTTTKSMPVMITTTTAKTTARTAAATTTTAASSTSTATATATATTRKTTTATTPTTTATTKTTTRTTTATETAATTEGSNSTVLISGSGLGSYYYDVTGLFCKGDLEPYAENNGYAYCEPPAGQGAETLEQRGTNLIVALANDEIAANKSGLCGKRVQVYYNGAAVDATFYVWDSCVACDGGVRLDFSLSALMSINSNVCELGIVSGISWEVLDEQVVPYVD
ncbi:hypothetical protein HDU83_000031 [Entophlyctis luteolus]|nr:hypothetical protein HDU83_000031 [Entophlyctis luteolus]